MVAAFEDVATTIAKDKPCLVQTLSHWRFGDKDLAHQGARQGRVESLGFAS